MFYPAHYFQPTSWLPFWIQSSGATSTPRRTTPAFWATTITKQTESRWSYQADDGPVTKNFQNNMTTVMLFDHPIMIFLIRLRCSIARLWETLSLLERSNLHLVSITGTIKIFINTLFRLWELLVLSASVQQWDPVSSIRDPGWIGLLGQVARLQISAAAVPSSNAQLLRLLLKRQCSPRWEEKGGKSPPP